MSAQLHDACSPTRLLHTRPYAQWYPRLLTLLLILPFPTYIPLDDLHAFSQFERFPTFVPKKVALTIYEKIIVIQKKSIG